MNSLLCIAISILLFGCSGATTLFQSDSNSNKSSAPNSTGGGNGDYYGGKPEPGTYSRLAGSSPCSASALPISEQIQINSESATLTKRDPATCRMIRTNLNLEDLEYAAYEPGRVGHTDGIYVKSGVWQSQGVNEAWCRREGSTSRTGYDVILTANYGTMRFAAKVSDSTILENGEIRLRHFDVNRVSRETRSEERIRYRAEGFELEIETKAFDSVTGKFKSTIKFEASGINVATSIGCRLSGELDSQSTNRD